MTGMAEAVETGLNELINEQLGTDAWKALLLALEKELMDVDAHHPEADRLQRMSRIAARELGMSRTFMLQESGRRWYLKAMLGGPVPSSNKSTRQCLHECLRSDHVLISIGIAHSPEHARLDTKGIVLVHLQPVTGCRAFVFGVLHGLGMRCRTPVVLRLLETHELNGHADLIGVEY
jgi:hypothetical protein